MTLRAPPPVEFVPTGKERPPMPPTKAQLAKEIADTIQAITEFNRRKMGVTCLVFIYREGDEPKFKLVGESLVYARGDRPVTLSKLNHADLSAILHQLKAYYDRISIPTGTTRKNVI